MKENPLAWSEDPEDHRRAGNLEATGLVVMALVLGYLKLKPIYYPPQPKSPLHTIVSPLPTKWYEQNTLHGDAAKYFNQEVIDGKYRLIDTVEDVEVYEDTDPRPPTVYAVEPHNPEGDPTAGVDYVEQELGCVADTATWYLEDGSIQTIDNGDMGKVYKKTAYAEFLCKKQ